MPHDRRVRVFLYLEPHDRIVVQQSRRRTQFRHVQLADVVVEKEHPRPPAHAADQQAKVALPADVERGRRYQALWQRRAEVKEVMLGTRANSQQCDLARLEPVENSRRARREGCRYRPRSGGTGSPPRTVLPEQRCSAVADSRNDDRIYERLGDGPLSGWSIDGTGRNIRKLKQVLIRLYLERSREFSAAFRFTQVCTSFHLGGHPTVHRSPPTTRTDGCSHATG